MKILSGAVLLFSIGMFLFSVILRKNRNKRQNKVRLFIGEHLLIWILMMIVNGISFMMSCGEASLSDVISVEKEDYGGQDKNIQLKLSKDEADKEIDFCVGPRKYTDKEAIKKMEEAFCYLKDNIKGNNANLERITTDLDFTLDEMKYPFDMECIPDAYALITSDGIVKNEEEYLAKLGYTEEDIQNGIPVKIRIILYYGALQKEKTITVVVCTKEVSDVEKSFSDAIKELEKAESSAAYDDKLLIPTNIHGVKVEQVDKGKIKPVHITLFGFLLSGLLLVREAEEEKERKRKRMECLRKSYPWFVNEIVLLLGAGMQVKNIFITLIKEYETQKVKGYQEVLIQELRTACHGLEVGMSESQVYYRLGRRIGLPSYIRLMTLLEQNVKKGSRGILTIMEQEEQNALEERKNMARRYGEEAGTKLLGPMILLLIIIMLIIMIPAFMSFQ